ncbi:unnamed protein product [Clonostachys solani]|uniref:CHAT domain-containing protein n=1 Tax=Clonostachys solani TaxID=160281 RepID=A0A9N9ZKM1_9HYPO|nr:unnamed protein product [Clonostachys solani]
MDSYVEDLEVLEITVVEYTATDTDTIRTWAISTQNPKFPQSRVHIDKFEDPFEKGQYALHDDYLTPSEKKAEAPAATTDDPDIHCRIELYCEKLVTQLRLENVKAKKLRIFVNEDPRTEAKSSIHCLLWELLEHRICKDKWGYDIQVTRIISCVKPNAVLPLALRDASQTCRVLLVVARSWQLVSTSHNPPYGYLDIPPKTVHHTLCKLVEYLDQSWRPSRLKLHVVRPGTLEELKRHLELAKGKGFEYDMIHLDMHGRLRQETGCDSDDELITNDKTYNFVSASDIAGVLRDFKISVVALSACQSAYSQTGLMSNLCHVFLEQGACAVTAMAFKVRALAVQNYYRGFYSALFIGDASYSTASVMARAYLCKEGKKPRARNELDSTGIPHQFFPKRVDTMVKSCFQPALFRPLGTINLALTGGLFSAPLLTGSWSLGALVAFMLSLLWLDYKALWRRLWFQFWPPSMEEFRMMLEDHSAEKNEKKPKPRKEPDPELSIGLMALEDQLMQNKTVFIQVDRRNHESHHMTELNYITRIWKMTELVNEVQIYDAESFKSTFWFNLTYYKTQVYDSVRRWLKTCTSWSQSERSGLARPPRLAYGSLKENASVLVFHNFDTVTKSDEIKYNISEFIKRLSENRCIYIILLGTDEADWESSPIDPGIHTWARGTMMRARHVLLRGYH